MKNKFTFVAVAIIILIIMLTVGIYIGKSINQEVKESFYAKVIENRGTYLLVEGIPQNDINYRGKFNISLKKPSSGNAVLDLAGNKISISDLPIGCLIRITYSGFVTETSPAGITGVLSIHIVE